eukprot:Em0006g564a
MAVGNKCVGLLALLVGFAVRFNDCQTILRHPSSQIVLPNNEATFICTVQTDEDYYVFINGQPTVPDQLPNVAIGPIIDEPHHVHTIPIVIVAILEYNMTTVQCSLDHDGYYNSATAYLWIAAQPLPPNPTLTQLNATTLFISWMAPFTHTSVAGILNYTVRMFNTVSHQWKSWTVSSSPPNTSSCHQADISEEIVHNCDKESVSRGLQMFFVTKALSDRNCDRFVVYVSANNVLGESERSGVEGTFPIAPEWIPGTDTLEVESYLQSNRNRTLLLAIKKPPYICPRQNAVYYLLKNNDTKRMLECNDSYPTLIDVSRDMAFEDGDVLTLLIVTLAGSASTSITVNTHWTSERARRELNYCSQIPIFIVSALGVLTCCIALLCLSSTLMIYIWKTRRTVTPSVHQEQCNQFYDETERNIYDQIEVCKGTTFSYPLAQ